MNQTKTVSISLTDNIINRICEYVSEKNINQKTLTITLMPYQFRFYKSIKKGSRSLVFSSLIVDFLNIIDKEGSKTFLFHSMGELVRNAIMYYLIFNKDNSILKDIPNRKNIKGNIPIGNIFHPDGDWKRYYDARDLSRYSVLDKIYEKVYKFFSLHDIVNNFEVFYGMYKDGLLESSLSENKIHELKTVLKNSNSG